MQAEIAEGGKSRTYIAQIDTLRAIAVIAVIIYHLNPAILPGGFSGVDVFFVISGFVVSGSLARDAAKPFAGFLLSFYARRILRIVPALIACLAISSVAANMLIPSSWLSSSSRDTAIYAFFGLSNMALIRSSDGYFSPKVEFNPFTHTWSLGVEEQFYLIFPLIVFVWINLRQKSNVLRVFGNWLLSVILLLSLAYSWRETGANPDRAYYLLPSRFWELAAGGVLFQLQAGKKVILNSRTGVNGATALGLLVILCGFVFSRQESFPFPWALLAVGGSMLSIAAVTSQPAGHSFLAQSLASPVLAWVGRLSYSLYLWHWPVFVSFRWTVGLQTFVHVAWALLLTAILAALSYYFVENRVRTSRLALEQPRWRVVVAGVACVLVCWTVTSKIFRLHDRISLSVTRDARSWYPYPAIHKTNVAQNHCKTEIKKFKVDGVGLKSYQWASCEHALPKRHQLFVVGDSHADAYARMLYKLTEEQGVTVLVYSKAGCSLANLLRTSQSSGVECARFLRTAVEHIKRRAAPGDIVFLAALRMYILGDQLSSSRESEVVAKQNSSQSRAERKDALQEADALIDALVRDNLRVIMDAPGPIFRSPAFRCSDRFNSQNPICAAGLSIGREFLLSLRQPIMDSLSALSARYPRLVVWDPFPILCPDDPCRAVDQRGPLFFDGDHLSGNANLLLYPSFLAELQRMWPLDEQVQAEVPPVSLTLPAVAEALR